MTDNVVIVGTGHAGFQLAATLRQSGFEGRIRLVGEEPGLPYQRPPLSKACLAAGATGEAVMQRPAEYYVANRIELLAPERARAIDRRAARLVLVSGERLDYGHLVLATGARGRSLGVPGADLSGVAVLRTAGDARHLRQRLATCRDAVVVGAGFIGLEFAAVAAARGLRVRVIEQGDRVMARAVSRQMSAGFEALHRDWGTEFRFGDSVARIVGEHGAVVAVETAGGERIEADLVVAGIGVAPCMELAEAAGLPVDNGIVVDGMMATADPAISAIGDCAAHPNPFADGRIRLESVQNATDQARLLAARLAGRAVAPFAAVPWFWSDQGPAKLQIAGIARPGDDAVPRGDPGGTAFSVFRFRDGRLRAVESLGRPADHMAARQMLARGTPLTPHEAADPGFDLKARLAAPRQAAE